MNTKKYWVASGLSLSLVTTVISLIGQITWKDLSAVSLPGFVILTLGDELFFGGTIKYPTFTGTISFSFSLVLSFVVYFIVGAIIGWVYGKIKNRNVVR